MSAIDPGQIFACARVAQSEWAALPVRERVRILSRLRRAIAAERQTIVEAIVRDTGKSELDALSGDVLVTLEQMRVYEKHAPRWLKSRRVPKNGLFFAGCRFYEHHDPHGAVLVFSPANYPFQLAMVPALTALFAGNGVILKVSEDTPSVARVIQKLAATLPNGLLQVVLAEPQQAAGLIDARPDLIFFTGSSANGREVAARAAQQLVPAILELGGKDPAVVFADCDIERAIEGVAYGAFSNAGQVCVGTKRLLVEQSIYEPFITKLKERLRAVREWPAEDFDVPAVKSDRLRARLQNQVQDAKDRGAEVLIGSECDRPLVLANVARDAKLITQESFGPVLCVESFATQEEAIELANDSDFALGASVWTRDLDRGSRVASLLHAGTCAVNDVIRNIANPYASFGGNASSGYGRYHGAEGLLAFTRTKSVMSTGSRRRTELHWFPLSKSKHRWLDRMIELRHRPRGWSAAVRRLLSIVTLLCIFVPASRAQNGDEGHLRLEVRVPPHQHCRLAWSVFASQDGFPGNPRRSVGHGFSGEFENQPIVDVDTGPLRPGNYAVAVYLDENGNGKLDYGIFGIPKEPVGASNNPPAKHGPPLFRDSAFRHGENDQTILIRMVKPR